MPEPTDRTRAAMRVTERRAMEIRARARWDHVARFAALWSLGYWAGELIWAVIPGSTLDDTNLSDVVIYLVSTLLTAAILYAIRYGQDRRDVRQRVADYYANQPHPPSTRKP